jgi:cardiolipin synthase
MTEKLRAKGLELYELHSKLLHMKMYIVDDSVYTLGSFNNDRISWRINNELNVLIKDFSQTAELKKVVDNLK